MPPYVLLIFIPPILAVIAVLMFFVGSAAWLTRGCGERNGLLLASLAFPIAAAIWIGSNQQPPENKDVFNCMLPNGYHMLMMDAPEHASLYSLNPRSPQLANVELLQIHEPYLLGAYTNREYFIANASTGIVSVFKTEEQFKSAAGEIGIKPELETVAQLHQRYRTRRLSSVEVYAPVSIGFLGLLGWVWWIRRTRRRAATI